MRSLRNKLNTWLLVALLALGSGALLGGCEYEEGTGEEAGEEVDDALDEADEEVDDALDEADEELDELGDELDEDDKFDRMNENDDPLDEKEIDVETDDAELEVD
ncbi:MAG: hypothetical protein ACLFVU_00635 [Phycisphaerae bacterium]